MKPVSKQAVLTHLLEQGSVYLHLDATRQGVQVPDSNKKDTMLTLVLGYGLALPIPDLDVGSDGVTATLSFSQSPFHCFLPWFSIFAMSTEDGTHLVWPSDAPKQVSFGGLDITSVERIQESAASQHPPVRSNRSAADEQDAIVILSPNAEKDTALQEILAPLADGQSENPAGLDDKIRPMDRAAFSVLDGGRTRSVDKEKDLPADTKSRHDPRRDSAGLKLVK